MGKEEYLRLIAEEVDRFMTEEWSPPKQVPTPEDWVKTGKWMQGKSRTEEHTYKEIDGKRTSTGRMKPVWEHSSATTIY